MKSELESEYKSILNWITSLSASVIQVNFYTHNIKYRNENLPHKCAYFVTKRYHFNSVGASCPPFLRHSLGCKNRSCKNINFVTLNKWFCWNSMHHERHCYTLHIFFPVSCLFRCYWHHPKATQQKKAMEKRTELKLFSIEWLGIWWSVNG